MKVQIHLIRHGRTAGNGEHRYVGRTDEPLCAEGAEALADVKAPEAELLFVSPMRRCVETARILYPQLEAVSVPELSECDFGAFEGKNWQELSGDPDYQRWIDSNGTLPFPGGESRDGFCGRCCAGFLRVMERIRAAGCRKAAVVAHGGTIMAVMDAWSEPHRDYYGWQIGNGEWITVRTQTEEWGADPKLIPIR
ncbi:MAG TPA: histidine phosphatase family protein [Lachnospiraceae bacterium]|nr:histidine phosphatase family protein [Lachnospiraceae bacterium]